MRSPDALTWVNLDVNARKQITPPITREFASPGKCAPVSSRDEKLRMEVSSRRVVKTAIANRESSSARLIDAPMSCAMPQRVSF